MLALKENALTPATIANKTELYLSHVSTTLSELTDKNLVACLTPKLKKGRLYVLTKEGRKLLQYLNT